MFIYTITNLVNGKQYVGQTIQFPAIKRWKRHIADVYKLDTILYRALRKYGIEKFSFKVIDSCLSNEELNEAEIDWIEALNTFRGDGYNMTSGGDSYIMSEEQKKKISASLKQIDWGAMTERNKKISIAHTGVKKATAAVEKTAATKRKVVYQYDSKGTYMAQYGSYREAAALTNTHKDAISNCIRGLVHTAGGFIWRLFKATKITTHIPLNKRRILQYTVDGVFVAKFDSISRAEKNLNINSISCVCLGKRKTAGGFIWKFNDG